MVFYQFQQAGNEEFQSMKKWNSAVGIVAAGTNGTTMNSEAKIQYVGIFAIIAKITVHSENFNFLYACIFYYDNEFSLS